MRYSVTFYIEVPDASEQQEQELVSDWIDLCDKVESPLVTVVRGGMFTKFAIVESRD